MALPNWINKYKEKGTSIRKKGNKYYKYKVHSVRKPDKKYPVLIQDELLGIITKENGFVSSKRKSIVPSDTQVVTLYSFANNGLFIEAFGGREIDELKQIYLMKINDKYYFSKLDEYQKKFLDEHGVNYHNGIFN